MPYAKSELSEVSTELLETFHSLGANAGQVELVKRDELYNYELKASFFNGNAKYSVNAERIEIALFNGRSREDLSTIASSVIFLSKHSLIPIDASQALIGYSHAKPSSDSDRDAFFRTFCNLDNVVLSAITANIRPPNWPDEMRLLVQPSGLVPSGLFLSWSTSLTERKLSPETLEEFGKAIGAAANMLGIDFVELK